MWCLGGEEVPPSTVWEREVGRSRRALAGQVVGGSAEPSQTGRAEHGRCTDTLTAACLSRKVRVVLTGSQIWAGYGDHDLRSPCKPQWESWCCCHSLDGEYVSLNLTIHVYRMGIQWTWEGYCRGDQSWLMRTGYRCHFFAPR